MQRSARTAHTIRPFWSGSSTMQFATGQAAWQIEQANAPKQLSGSMTAIVLGAFFRGPLIIFVHMVSQLYLDGRASGLYRLNKGQIRERGARLTRRDDREYREYLRKE